MEAERLIEKHPHMRTCEGDSVGSNCVEKRRAYILPELSISLIYS